MANFKYHTSCPKCGSSDALAVYDDESVYCWSCTYTTLSEEMKEEYEKNKKNRKGSTKNKEKKLTDKIQKVDESKLKPVITEEQTQEIKESTWLEGSEYRGIKDWVLKYFGVRTEYDEESNVIGRYYPCTYQGELSGYKIRQHPKDFRSVGRTGKECDLFGQFRFTAPNKYVLIVGGEEDQLAAYQMLREYQVRKGTDNFDAIPVVSPTIGETGSAQQLALQYKFFDMFEKIILCYDNDEAGEKATEKAVSVLPKGKVHIMSLRHKDPNEYLVEDDEGKFVQDFFAAKKYTPAGVVGSSELYEKLIESVNVKKIPLPPFLTKLDEMLGSVELGTIGIFAAGSGAAKTTVANEIIYHWLFNSPYKIGIVSLELTCGQYAQAMLSRHINNKISNIKDPDEKVKYLQGEFVKTKADELFKTDSSEDRFVVIDERDGDIETLQGKIEEMIITCSVKVIVLDPISDLLDGLSNSDAALFMKWQKSMVKNYNVTFINISHIRKGSSNSESASTGAFVPEESVIGASQQVKSASWVVMMTRDKYNEDPIVRNTTNLVLSKNRSNGVTGSAGSIYYCNKTHRLHDLETYLQDNPELAAGF